MKIPGFTASQALLLPDTAFQARARAGAPAGVVPSAPLCDWCEKVCERVGWHTYSCLRCYQNCE